MLEVYILILLLLTPYFVVIFYNAVQSIYLWQIKEYRLDRVWSHYQYEGRLSLNDEFELIIKIALLTLILLYYFSPYSVVLSIGMFLSYFYYQLAAFDYYAKIFTKRINRPRLKSPRNLLIVLTFSLITAGIYIYFLSLVFANGGSLFNVFNNIALTPATSEDTLVGAFKLVTDVDGVKIVSFPILIITIFSAISIIIDLTSPIIIAILVYLTSPISKYKKILYLSKAKNKIQNFDKLITVAVTGSYGKTTTKEMLFQLSNEKFVTTKTQEHNNTDVGIANTVLKYLNKNTQVFVAEMGAYKLKETAECAEIANPDIVLVTGLDEQHFSLYGGVEQILESTVEIERYLKPGGLFIINGNDEYCMKLDKRIKAQKVFYKKDNKKCLEKLDDGNFYYGEFDHDGSGYSAKCSYLGKTFSLKTKVNVEHNIHNLIACIIALYDIGMKMKDILELVHNKKFVFPYLNEINAINDSRIIDDGYNINPSGYVSGLNHLSKQKTEGKKWVFTQGIIELGNIRDKIYKKLAEETVTKADGLITNDEHFAEFVADAKADFEIIDLRTVFDFPAVYKHYIKKGDIVLLEGPIPQRLLNKVTKHD